MIELIYELDTLLVEWKPEKFYKGDILAGIDPVEVFFLPLWTSCHELM